MGATNNIKETNIDLQLEGKECPNCSQKFTEQEIADRNYDIYFDTTNDVELIPMSEVKETNLYFPSGRKGYQLTIWIRSIEHKDCPNTKTCQRCWERLITGKIKEFQGNYYCFPCYQQLEKEKDHV